MNKRIFSIISFALSFLLFAQSAQVVTASQILHSFPLIPLSARLMHNPIRTNHFSPVIRLPATIPTQTLHRTLLLTAKSEEWW
jgi:hypothetical protein